MFFNKPSDPDSVFSCEYYTLFILISGVLVFSFNPANLCTVLDTCKASTF